MSRNIENKMNLFAESQKGINYETSKALLVLNNKFEISHFVNSVCN